MIPNYDQEIERKYHPENFENHDLSVANENTEKLTIDDGYSKVEIGKIGKGRFKYGIRKVVQDVAVDNKNE